MMKKLEKHKSAQCHVEIKDSGEIQFWSYATKVITIKENSLHCTGLYSMTTRKQIGWFLSEYLPHINYYDIKRATETNRGVLSW